MKVIDPRSGHEMKVGATVSYPDDESITLIAVDGGSRPHAQVRVNYRSPDTGEMVTADHRLALVVRWTHPAFFLQRVGFLPT